MPTREKDAGNRIWLYSISSVYLWKKVAVETDHKSPEAICRKPMHRALLRFQRWLLMLQKYQLEVGYRPGKELVIADTLSRVYMLHDEGVSSEEADVGLHLISFYLPIAKQKLKEFQAVPANNVVLQTIWQRGPDNRSVVPEVIRVIGHTEKTQGTHF